ncbi:MAG TPA: DUF3455 domain-containing protein [Paraburkholderia sp.]|jgi:hypothetical protein|nr:DUF3455 domain-containing protein [Paraburkholderia sp.]
MQSLSVRGGFTRAPRRLLLRAASGVGALVFALAGAGCAVPPRVDATANLPPEVAPRRGEIADGVLYAQGTMRYQCSRALLSADMPSPHGAFAPRFAPLPDALDSFGYAWKPVGTLARLYDEAGRLVGLVTPEGYYTADDGSYLVARVTSAVQPDPQALPWTRETIRLRESSAFGAGRFSQINAIVRTQTVGGLAPEQPCGLQGVSVAVPYFATYVTFRSDASAARRPPAPAAAQPLRGMPAHLSAR